MKKKYTFGVLGHHISYSLSPQLFDAIAAIKNFTCRFVSHDIAVEQFQTEFPEVIKSGIDGFSVTIPHKSRVIGFMDRIDPVAERIGAVNSVAVRNQLAHGFNTDGAGFAVPLDKYRSTLSQGTALIVGAGGAARAVVNCLANEFAVPRLVVLGRNEKRLQQFAESLQMCLGASELKICLLSRFEWPSYDDYTIAVNCTPLGGWNHIHENPMPPGFKWLAGRIYYDLNYNDDNRLVYHANRNGMTAFDGSAMLIGQALRSFYLWTGETVDFDPVYSAVFPNR